MPEPASTSPLPAPSESCPERIGPYQILDRLGEGGMGTVWLAEQKHPVRRRVALKVIKLGMDSKAVLRRFELERQALAVMNHDAIARVLEAGITEQGHPFFAMELVEGIPLDDYCDRHRLSLQDRITLFQQVCAGVQHAHQKGVIHRDLKPGNVLVSRKGEAHQAKVIDFGVARATDHQLVQHTIFTEQGQMIGTPEYMSPEQAAGEALQIDTRTDVYSLGAMLYELLTGQQPFPAHELRRAGLLEIQRMLREVEPPKPSTRITTLGAVATDVAGRLRTTPEALGRELRRDLDWIVLKAMSKEPERRYGSPAELAADLQRYLRHEPVLAGPPGAGYRLKKFLRRYRVQCIAAAAVFAAIVLGIVGTAWFAVEAGAERTEAKRQEGIAVERAAEALSRKAEFDQLAGVVLLERAETGEKDLYPAWPHKIGPMRAWLEGDVARLSGMLPQLRQTVRDVEERALPATAEEIEADRRTHPRFAEWQRLQAKVASLRRAHAVRSGRTFVETELPAELRGKTASELNGIAWPRVDFDEPKRTWGEEGMALAAARAGLSKLEHGDTSIERCIRARRWPRREPRGRRSTRATWTSCASTSPPGRATRAPRNWRCWNRSWRRWTPRSRRGGRTGSGPSRNRSGSCTTRWRG
jgi:hypothetical protein